MVRTLKDAIILSEIKETPKTSEQIAESMKISKPHVTKSLSAMKKSGLVRGRGTYVITSKGRTHFDNTLRKIDGHS